MSTILIARPPGRGPRPVAKTTPFGRTLRRIREQREPELSQSRLARRAGFNHSHLSRLESGSRMPTMDAVYRLARALAATNEERYDLLVAAGFIPEDSLELVRLWARVPVGLRDRIMAVIEAVADGEEDAA